MERVSPDRTASSEVAASAVQGEARGAGAPGRWAALRAWVPVEVRCWPAVDGDVLRVCWPAAAQPDWRVALARELLEALREEARERRLLVMGASACVGGVSPFAARRLREAPRELVLHIALPAPPAHGELLCAAALGRCEGIARAVAEGRLRVRFHVVDDELPVGVPPAL
jgi:hypothetical protein